MATAQEALRDLEGKAIRYRHAGDTEEACGIVAGGNLYNFPVVSGRLAVSVPTGRSAFRVHALYVRPETVNMDSLLPDDWVSGLLLNELVDALVRARRFEGEASLAVAVHVSVR